MANMEKATAIMEFNQNIGLFFVGLKVRLKKTTGNTKSSGKKPNAPINALMSLKKGSIAANVVAIITESDREIALGMMFLAENSLLLGSANVRSSTSFVGCRKDFGEAIFNLYERKQQWHKRYRRGRVQGRAS